MRVFRAAISILAVAFSGPLNAEIKVDQAVFGESLGGWSKRSGQAAEYALSGSSYRTYKPEISATPEGGIFVSVRIDHVRGWMSSDDHATLEITVGPTGVISSAKSNIAIQGRSIASDVILGTSAAGQEVTGADRAVQIGTDLVADLSSKLLREKIVEAGRVTFPAAIRHNYNKLYQALRLDGQAVPTLAPIIPPPPAVASTPATTTPAEVKKPAEPKPEPPPPVAKPVKGNAGVEISPYGGTGAADLKAE
jgi:hypothetical protein